MLIILHFINVLKYLAWAYRPGLKNLWSMLKCLKEA